MQSEEQKIIDGLFSRLQQAESQSGPRDAGAEQLIKNHLQNQPAAAYYMAQAILIQEAALKKLNEQVSSLENQLKQQQQQPQQSSGGFLSGLFGGGNSQPRQAAPAQPAWGSQPQQPAQQPGYTSAPAAAPRGTGFLGGALQTAAGVAGGVVLADMLTSMFHHSQPEEIVNIINEPPLETPDYDQGLDTFNQGDNAFQADDNRWDDNSSGGFDSFLGDDSFNDDDDSFL